MEVDETYGEEVGQSGNDGDELLDTGIEHSQREENTEQTMETGEPNIEVKTFKIYRCKKKTEKKNEGVEKISRMG